MICVFQQHPYDIVYLHGIMVRVPAVEVRDHCHRGIGYFRLPGQFRLGHIGHADHMAAPLAVQIAFRQGRKLWPFHAQVGAAPIHGDAGLPGRLFAPVSQAGIDRVGQGDMGHHARPEKTLLPQKGPVDELIDDDEGAGGQFLLE